MATAARLTPTIFDKLVADVEISGLRAVDTPQVMSEIMSFYPVPEIKRFGEAALRATVKRDLAWLLNTTQFGARADLEGYAEVQASVLNFGVPDLAGRSHHARTILDLAREIRDFDPNLRDTSSIPRASSWSRSHRRTKPIPWSS